MFLTVGAFQSASADDDSAALKASSDALLKVKSYRVHATTLLQGKTYTRTIEFVTPDRMHIIDERMEMIIVPEGTYQKLAGGKWEKSPVDMSTLFAKARTSEFANSVLKDTQVHLIGPDTLNGKPMMVYEVIYTSPDLKSRSRVWINTSDHLPYKSETESETKEVKMMDKTLGGKSKTTNVYTDYNVPIKIVAPTL
jgi:hypothetical protein